MKKRSQSVLRPCGRIVSTTDWPGSMLLSAWATVGYWLTQLERRCGVSRCDCCDCILTPYELSVRSIGSGQYMNMCYACLRFVRDDVAVIGDRRLLHDEAGTEVALYSNNIESLNNNHNDYTKD